jgi:hypothetical protein
MNQRRSHCLVFALFALHGGLLAFSAAEHSPVISEAKHLPAGLSHLYLGRFDLFRVNPPLVRMVAALPVALMSPATAWQSYGPFPLARYDVAVAKDFLEANGPRSLGFFTVARWACIPFSILGGYVCFRWARDLYGVYAGFLALVLWCFCPYILGHAALITPDAHAAALGVAAYYLFWRWLNRAGLAETLVAGVVLGLAELAKFTLLVFYPLWILTWCSYKLPEHGLTNPRGWWREARLLVGMMLLSVVVINLGYGFEGSLRPIGEYRFRSQLFGGKSRESDGSRGKANRCADTCWASLPVPVPANYLQGIDAERRDFEQGLPSYLRGEWSKHGWWYYYLYALGVKLPLGTWCLILMAVPYSFWSRYRSTWRDELVLLLPIVAILALVSSQTGFSVHSRYVLPILPFAYVWCSKMARSIEARHTIVALGGALALCWSVGSSLWVYPHSLSYFNELVGGPMGGHAHLLDSNIAWGQDLYFLKRWYDGHPDARPLHLANYYGLLDPRLTGLEFTAPPVGPTGKMETSSVCQNDPPNVRPVSGVTHNLPPSLPSPDLRLDEMGPQPGWYAIDVNHLHGAKLALSDGRGGARIVARDGYDFSYFQRFQPMAMAGYSIYIYHITVDEANRVRWQLGLPELTKGERG